MVQTGGPASVAPSCLKLTLFDLFLSWQSVLHFMIKAKNENSKYRCSANLPILNGTFRVSFKSQFIGSEKVVAISDNIYSDTTTMLALRNRTCHPIFLVLCLSSSWKKYSKTHKTLMVAIQSKSQGQCQSKWQRQPPLTSATLSFLKCGTYQSYFFVPKIKVSNLPIICT